MPQMNILPANLLPSVSNGAAEVGIRPEHLTAVDANGAALSGTVELVESLGNETLIHLNVVGGHSVIVRQYVRTELKVGDAVGVDFDADRVHRFDSNGVTV